MADIEKMKKKLEEMKAKIKAAESRETKKKRAADTRKKILIGAIVLDEMSKNKKFHEHVMTMLDSKLTRSQDRILFELEAKIQTQPQQQQKQKTDTTKSTISAPTSAPSAPAAATKTSEQKSKPAPDKK